jgi:hypothetical protein
MLNTDHAGEPAFKLTNQGTIISQTPSVKHCRKPLKEFGPIADVWSANMQWLGK